MFRSNEVLQAKTGRGFRAAEERAHVHFLGAQADAELTAALSPAELDALLDEILATKGDDRETWSAGIEYADACIKRKIRVIDRNLDALAENGSADSPALREALALLRAQEGRISERLASSDVGVPKEELRRLSGTLSGYVDCLLSITAEAGAGDRELERKKQEKKTRDLDAAYSLAGIDAAGVYAEAIAAYEKNDSDEALRLFQMIPDYRRAGLYIAELCRFHVVRTDDPKIDVLWFRCRPYLVRNGVVYPERAKLFDVGAPISTDTRGAHVVGAYGDRLYYVPGGEGRGIAFFATDREGRRSLGRYSVYGAIRTQEIRFLSDDRRSIVFTVDYDPKKDKRLKKRFCRSHGIAYLRFRAKKKVDFSEWRDLFRFDLDTGKLTLLAEGATDVAEVLNDVVYFYALQPILNKKGKKIVGLRNEKALRSLDLSSGKQREELSGNGRIVAITPDRKIVFTRIDHHSIRNKTVYVKDGLSGGGEKALARNVYDVFDLVNGRLFYLVGNDGIRSLCSVRLDGTSFREELKYTRDVVARDNDWIYLTAGRDQLSLFRLPVSNEGDGVNRVALGINPDFTRDEKLTVSGDYVYFKNNSDVLCRVKTDGSDYREIVVGIAKLVTVTPEKVLYLAVDGRNADGDPVYSLYGMDSDGANREKLIFCMADIVKVNDWQCLYVRDEKLASKKDIYAAVTDPKLRRQIDKNYKKFQKKKKTPSSVVDTVRLFDLRTKASETAAYLEPYPTKYSLKRERKELLKKK
ncbi:MAG: DUF5050 domain-containing protein [Clostridia bacterium]|nr:DUF5050 domain-containing protein [Clostridia bacterium]